MRPFDLSQVDSPLQPVEAECVTLGVHRGLMPLIQWSEKIGLQKPLLATIDATKTFSDSQNVGSVLRYLSLPEVARLLCDWREESTCAADLSNLSSACIASPFISQAFPGMPAVRRVADQMRGGDLSNFPLLALTVRPIIDSSQEHDPVWIEALRTWAFVKSVESIYQGGNPSPYLTEIIDKLRLGIDKEPQWLKLFFLMRGPTISFHGLTRDLAQASKRVIGHQGGPVLRPSHKVLLSRLNSYCLGKENAGDQVIGAGGHSILREYFINAKTAHHQPSQYLWRTPFNDAGIDGLDGGSLSTERDDPDNSKLGAGGTQHVEESKSPPQQIGDAKGIVLATAEDHQFLTYSWNRPSPAERTELEKWLSESHASDSVELQVLATFTEIAIKTANSLDTVLRLQLTVVTGPDWAIDIETGTLHRLAPRRYSGWKATPESANWVLPLAKHTRAMLSPEASKSLKRFHAEKTEASQLGHFWQSKKKATPATTFNGLCKNTPNLRRLRSGMLAQVLEQHVFNKTTDPVLSELLASSPRSGLGGACAYSSYSNTKIQNAVTGILPEPEPEKPDQEQDRDSGELNAAGSELSPIDSVLRQAVSQAFDKVSQLSTLPPRWAEHHNALTSYVVMAMLAATAGRPISSPFESLTDIDWLLKAIYMEDKVSSSLHHGRLVPVPESIIALLRDIYIPHLSRLSALVSEIDPPLSQVLYKMAQYEQSEHLPLFFFLRLEPRLRWFEVTEASLSALEIFSWPLPWNLMRHRLPTTLKTAAQDHEIINGITGHGEHGTAPYGGFSLRVWMDDAKEIRPAQTQALLSLQFEQPAATTWPPLPVPHSGTDSPRSCIVKDARFGTSARAARRDQSHRIASMQAEAEIIDFVGTRPVESLSPNEWENLSRKMLLHDDGRPRTFGSLRYEKLQQWLTQQWSDKGARPKLKKRYLPALEEKSPISPGVVNCHVRLGQALELLRGITDGWQPSRSGYKTALALGIALLVLESRVADRPLLSDLFRCKNFRLVHLQGQYYLEHSLGLDSVPDIAVKRFPISSTAARLFAKAKSGTNQIDVSACEPADGNPDIWMPFFRQGNLSVKFSPCIDAAVLVVQQANAIEFPGVVAGYLNGSIVSAGLRHADLIRATVGKAPLELPSLATKPRSHAGEEANSVAANAQSATTKSSTVASEPAGTKQEDPDSVPQELDDAYRAWSEVFIADTAATNSGPPNITRLQQASFNFFQEIRSAIHTASSMPANSRKVLDSEIRSLLSDHQDSVSRSCLLLGEWLRSLLWRKTSKGLIRLRSISRYMNALSGCFQALAYAHDLLKCDPDEVTEFYRQVMELRREIRPGRKLDHAGETDIGDAVGNDAGCDTEDDADSAEQSNHYRSQALALQLLQDFHRLMRREFGAEDPDWSEIDTGEQLLSISPGLMCEAEYLCALQILAVHPSLATREQLARAFLLLVMYRFGLRGEEATGLLRCDWVDEQPNSIVVLVRTNRFRTIKTTAGQRQVPLLFELTAHEVEIVHSWLDSFAGITSLDASGALFASLESPEKLMNVLLLRKQVGDVMKRVTCNQDLSPHHARHSFANRVFLLLASNVEDTWAHVSTQAQSDISRRHHVRRLLLGTDKVTRRTLWALARLLGHAHPSTTVKSYLHLMPELVAHYVKFPLNRARKSAQEVSVFCVDLDGLEYRDNYLQPGATAEPVAVVSAATPDQALRFLLLYRRGCSRERAQQLSHLSEEIASRLVHGVDLIETILATRPHLNTTVDGPSTLLGHIPESRWARLIKMSYSVQRSNSLLDAAALDFGELGVMVGASRQILLWKPAHFQFFKAVLSSWGIDEHSYKVHSTVRNKGYFLKLAEDAGLGLGIDPAPCVPTDEGTKVKNFLKGIRKSKQIRSADFQQIDPVVNNDPVFTVGQRCGVFTQTHPLSKLRSSHELVLILLVSIALQSGQLATS